MIKVLQFIPVQLTFFLVLGIVFGYYFQLPLPTIFYLLIGLFVLLGLFYWYSDISFKRYLYFSIITYFITFFIGVSTLSISNELNYDTHYSHFLQNENEVILIIEKSLKQGNYNDKYEARVSRLNQHKTLGKVLINVKKDSLNRLKIDDRLYVKSKLLEIQPPKNPYYFDYGNYLKKHSIYHQLFLENGEFLKLESRNFSFHGIADRLRKRINNKLKENGFKGDELAVINALLLGQRQDISPELLDSYSGAGAIHILAVSGLHVGILLLILNFIFNPLERLRKGKFIKLIVVISVLWTFAFIAGMSASVVRAVTMFSAVAIGMLVNRPSNIYNTLVISMFFLLLFNPYFLFDVGFQLSYLAVFAIVWIQPMLYKLWKPKWKVSDYFWQLLTVSIAAQVGVIPLSLYYFHQFPSLFFISNLVIIPALGLILVSGVVVIFLSLLNMLPSIISTTYNHLIQFMNYVVERVAKQEDFLIKDISFSLAMVFSSYLIILFGVRFLKDRKFIRFVGLLTSIVLLQFVFIFEKKERQSTDELVVFNKSRHSIVGDRKGENMVFYHTLDSVGLKNDRIMKQYNIGFGNLSLEKIFRIPSFLSYKNTRILIVDSLGIYNVNGYNPEIIIVQQSPKINLERMIDLLKPKLIVADASNYKSYVQRWEKTCEQKNTPFHYTDRKGAFILNK